MAILGWIITTITSLAGMTLMWDAPFAHADHAAMLLFGASVLACPLIWEELLEGSILKGKEPLVGSIGLLLALPIFLLH